MDNICNINADALYQGATLSFTYNHKNYVMHTVMGNRGKMVIRLLNINLSKSTYNWRYTHKDEVSKSKYKKIELAG